MKKLFEIQDLTIHNKEKVLLQKVSLCFYEGVNVFLCGTNASGKTLLLKAIAGEKKYSGRLHKLCKVEVLLDTKLFEEETVMESLNYKTLDEKQKKIVNKFITKNTLNKKIKDINLESRKLLLICKSFLKQPKLLFVDNLFSYINEKMLQKIYKYAKSEKITLVNVSTNIEHSLNYQYMVVFDKGSIAIEGKTLQVLEQEKLLKRLGIGLPFYVDLSIQLRLYNLIDKVYCSKEELVGALWK